MQCTDVLPDFSGCLGSTVLLATAHAPMAIELLTAAEQELSRAIPGRLALDDWLRGRAALKSLVAGDTARLTFPNPRLSLTHAGGSAFAACAQDEVAGIGIDFEPWRAQVRMQMSPFFLTGAEQRVATGARELIRLWTVKEALFKAYARNVECILLDFVLSDAGSQCGSATAPNGQTMIYASSDVGPGCLSVAVMPLGGGHVAV